MVFCDGSGATRAKPFDTCEKTPGHDALSMGFVTSEERVRVIPPGGLPAPFKPRGEPFQWPGGRP